MIKPTAWTFLRTGSREKRRRWSERQRGSGLFSRVNGLTITQNKHQNKHQNHHQRRTMSSTSKNDITGDKIQTKPGGQLYRVGWDRVFGNVNNQAYEVMPLTPRERTLTRCNDGYGSEAASKRDEAPACEYKPRGKESF